MLFYEFVCVSVLDVGGLVASTFLPFSSPLSSFFPLLLPVSSLLSSPSLDPPYHLILSPLLLPSKKYDAAITLLGA